ncbi:MAG: 3-carboxymuconate cyclase [Verrucomicrobiales bacterium]|nr:3-carboxymuconate cyclase [Verrucomicrobiales bacterium]
MQPTWLVRIVLLLLSFHFPLYAQPTPQQIYSFTTGPRGPITLVEGPDGVIYGTTAWGGPSNDGTVFRLDHEKVQMIPNTNAFGNLTSLVAGNDGKLYGLADAEEGAAMTFYSVGADGKITVLSQKMSRVVFDDAANSLFKGQDGNIYAVLPNGRGAVDENNCIARLDPDGLLTTILSFGHTNEGMLIGAIQDGENNFYALLRSSESQSSIVRISSTGTRTTVSSFDSDNTGLPICLIAGRDGNVYLLTSASRLGGIGSILKIVPSGVMTFVTENIVGGIVTMLQGIDGFLYAVTAGDLWEPANGYKIDVATGESSKIWSTRSGDYGWHRTLLQTSDGTFYSSDLYSEQEVFGSIFVVKDESEQLISFYDGLGIHLFNALGLGADGNLYGTTATGRTQNQGTLFQRTPDGKITHLTQLPPGTASFTPLPNSDGTFYALNGGVFLVSRTGDVQPLSGTSYGLLFQGIDGAFYGVDGNDGTKLFRLELNGRRTLLHSFPFFENSFPAVTALAQGDNGDLLGCVESNGDYLFKVTRDGHYTRLGNVQGRIYEMTVGDDGNFYALADSFDGHRFLRISPSGMVTTLAVLDNTIDAPFKALLASDGNFYVTTLNSLLRLTKKGTVSKVLDFEFQPWVNDNPVRAGIEQGADGALYGILEYGGTASLGSIYKVDLKLPPPLKVNSTFQKVAVGTYNGEVRRAGQSQAIGYFTFKVSANRRFQGRIILNGQVSQLSGQFNERNSVSVPLASLFGPSATLFMNLKNNGTFVDVNGSVSGPTFNALVKGRRSR